jgi:hypothetical protein
MILLISSDTQNCFTISAVAGGSTELKGLMSHDVLQHVCTNSVVAFLMT